MADNKDFMLTDDMTLDQVEDMPSFEVWPTGMYKVVLNDGITSDTIADSPVFKAEMTLLEIKAISDESVEEANYPKVNSSTDLLFFRNNTYSAASYKKLATPIAKLLGVNTISEINEGSKGVELIVLLQKKQNKKDPTKFFTQLLEALPAEG